MTLTVEVAHDVTDELVDAFVRLVPQLSRTAPTPDHALISRVVGCEANTVFIARDGERIVGTLTLVVFPLPTSIRAWIEDVVVDSDARGLGVGVALTEAALARAGELGARTVDLTSRPSREAANRLYQRVGFQVRTTNVYRYEQPEPQGETAVTPNP